MRTWHRLAADVQLQQLTVGILCNGIASSFSAASQKLTLPRTRRNTSAMSKWTDARNSPSLSQRQDCRRQHHTPYAVRYSTAAQKHISKSRSFYRFLQNVCTSEMWAVWRLFICLFVWQTRSGSGIFNMCEFRCLQFSGYGHHFFNLSAQNSL